MNKGSLLLMAITCFFCFAGCKKETVTVADCQQLQTGITANNKEDVKAAISAFISGLPSQTYTEQNLNKLVAAIGKQCGAQATLVCFDCIETLPTQSEIRIGYLSINGPVEKSIDISYNSSNKIVFVNMHD